MDNGEKREMRDGGQVRLFTLERPADSVTWELRARWAKRQEVVLNPLCPLLASTA